MQLDMLELKVTDESNQSVAVSKWKADGEEFTISMAGPLGMTYEQFIEASKPQAEAFAQRMASAPKPLP